MINKQEIIEKLTKRDIVLNNTQEYYLTQLIDDINSLGGTSYTEDVLLAMIMCSCS